MFIIRPDTFLDLCHLVERRGKYEYFNRAPQVAIIELTRSLVSIIPTDNYIFNWFESGFTSKNGVTITKYNIRAKLTMKRIGIISTFRRNDDEYPYDFSILVVE